MAVRNAVWGIDVGQCALKAVKLRPAEDGRVEIEAFDYIEHPKILSQPDADADELINAALEKFASRNEWQGDAFVIGIPGHQTFARFCKLPPVEPKKIPDIVRFEAGQQIPFDINEVVWDYAVFQAEDSPDVEVGIFAIRKDLIRKHLEHFAVLKASPQVIQTMPSALYNFCRFDRAEDVEEGTATVIIDVGAQHTNLVVVEPYSAWTRNIPLGGNNFTEALVKNFKLSFAKAENLKCNAATSKYARQIFQAMRPVFAELVAEVQRSLGFYSSTHRDVELKQVLACGNAFRLPGLQKYLENNLTISGGVRKLESFKKVVPSATLNAPQFTENILTFGPAYGLALQGIGLARINANLLPPELARIALWKRKRPYFAATAACMALAAIMPLARGKIDEGALALTRDDALAAKRIIEQARRYDREYKKVAQSGQTERKTIEQLFELQKQADLIPRILAFVHRALPEPDPQIAAVKSPEDLKRLIQSNPGRYERTKRRQILLEGIDILYSDDIDNMPRPQSREAYQSGAGRRFSGRSMRPGLGLRPGGGRGMRPGGDAGLRPGGRVARARAEETTAPKARGFYVLIRGRILYGEERYQAQALITGDFYKRLAELGRQPGQGFWVPEEDPAAPDKRNLNPTISIVEAFPQEKAQLASGAAAAGTPAAAQAPGEQQGEAEKIVLVPDAVTGEEMATDWAFQLGFKIKLGEPPETGKKGDKKDD